MGGSVDGQAGLADGQAGLVDGQAGLRGCSRVDCTFALAPASVGGQAGLADGQAGLADGQAGLAGGQARAPKDTRADHTPVPAGAVGD